MIVKPDERNVATTGVDDGKSKWFKTEGRNNEVDKFAKTESPLTYKDEVCTRVTVVDERVEENIGGSRMVEHVRPDSRKTARNTNVSESSARVVHDDADAVGAKTLIRVTGILRQGLLSNEDVWISQTWLKQIRR